MRIINTKFIFKLVLLFFILLFLTSKPVKAGVISEEIITIDDFDLEDSGKILKTQGRPDTRPRFGALLAGFFCHGTRRHRASLPRPHRREVPPGGDGRRHFLVHRRDGRKD